MPVDYSKRTDSKVKVEVSAQPDSDDGELVECHLVDGLPKGTGMVFGMRDMARLARLGIKVERQTVDVKPEDMADNAPDYDPVGEGSRYRILDGYYFMDLSTSFGDIARAEILQISLFQIPTFHAVYPKLPREVNMYNAYATPSEINPITEQYHGMRLDKNGNLMRKNEKVDAFRNEKEMLEHLATWLKTTYWRVTFIHHSPMKISTLKAKFEKYGLDMPEFKAVDLMKIYEPLRNMGILGLPSLSLQDILKTTTGKDKSVDTNLNVYYMKNGCIKAMERLGLKTLQTFLGLRLLWKEEAEDPFSSEFQKKVSDFFDKYGDRDFAQKDRTGCFFIIPVLTGGMAAYKKI